MWATDIVKRNGKELLLATIKGKTKLCMPDINTIEI